MIARVADHCFWFGRYVERSESTARVLQVTRSLALDSELPPEQCWQTVLTVAGEKEAYVARHGEPAVADGERVQEFLTWEETNLVSLRHSVALARENARSVREAISLDAWEVTNDLHLWLTSPAAREEYEQNRYAFYQRVRHATQLCLGLLRSTMLHDAPLDFIWLGVLLERTGQTARLLDVHHHALTAVQAHPIVETALWLSLLRACSGFEPFLKRHQGRVTGRTVAAFLILEPRFPRAVRYCVRSALERLGEIRPPTAHGLPGGRALDRLRALDAWLADVSAEGLDEASIHDLLTHVVDEIAAVCEEVGAELLGYGNASMSSLPVAQ